MSDAEAPSNRKSLPARQDLTQGPIIRTLVAFAFPALASNALQAMNATVNAIWIGRFLGEGALAASANSSIVMFLVLSAVFGFGMAATVLVGQSAGRHDMVGARRSFGAAIGFCLALVIIAAIGGWFAAPNILHLLGTPTGAYSLALTYLRVIFLAMPAMMMMTMIMMGLRGVGDAMTPMWFMILSVILDAGLNPVFILGLGPAPRMGIGGSATATLIANMVSLIGIVAYIYARDLPLRLRGAELRYLWPQPALLKILLAKGLPMGLQMVMMSTAGLLMIGLVNREGLISTAAYSAVQQTWSYLQMPAMAIGTACSAMAAQNIGAQKWDRVGRITRTGVIANIVSTGIVLILMLVFDRPLLALFLGSSSHAIPIAQHIQYLASWGFLAFGVSMVLSGTMRANGVVIAPLVTLTIALFPARFGFYAIFHPLIGADALWLSFAVGSVASFLLGSAVYLHGGWRKAKLLAPVTEEETRETINAESEPAGRIAPTG